MIEINKDKIHFSFDPETAPVAYANDGDIVKFCCQDCYCEQILTDNFDFSGVGALLYLPVNVSGALLSMGDIHAVQGDGETVICALEMSGEVTVKVNVIRNRKDIPTPFIVTEIHYITTAADPSLDNCSVAAAKKMHRFLQQHSNLTDAQSGMLLSLAGNLRISQVVNPSKGCIMEFPIGLAKEKFEK